MNGVLNIYKERGMTSFQVVASVKRITGIKKVGHTGTLDPEAEGVLPVCVGRATKLVDYIMDGEKIYRASFQFGKISDTLDAFGEVQETGEPLPKLANVTEALQSFMGTTKQIPPMFSALKVQGKRLYELARDGKEIPREAREIHVSKIHLIEYREHSGEGSFLLVCSKGTYVRSIIDDLGRMLGSGAIMTGLVREATGGFQKDASVTLSRLEQEGVEKYLIGMEEVLKSFPALIVPDVFLNLIVNGVKVKDQRLVSSIKAGLYKGLDGQGKLLGILERTEDILYLRLNLM
ncbi:tRNA pseudouridine(55) synthase TruB [Proteiniclasticum ruminis]|uniref:tRNA pseudouridine(55) synthase TruB n=1 Tax=Proteiniclasticum ruminis TaxID=398199 RepID=UPI0028AC3F82|nr:tRNA pseudouridine(55) synthase TruB [Proteiniclasticum ruminis]